MEFLHAQFRHAARALWRSPGFTATAVVTLAIGIGIATAVFTVANALLLAPLPVHDQDRIVVLRGASTSGRFDNFPLVNNDALEFAARARAMERVEFFGFSGASQVAVRDGNSVSRMNRSLVSGGYFELLGTKPELGRALRPPDDKMGAEPVIVLSFGAWQRYFGADSNVVGRQIVMHATGIAHTIVGVMPLGLDYPRGSEFWAPVNPNSQQLNGQVYTELHAIGRLRAGASAMNAADELTAFFARAEVNRWQRDMHGVARSLPDAITGDVRPAVLAFAAASGLLLLITCANMANLLLVRGLARVRQIAVQRAVGATSWRVVAIPLMESVLLAGAGGVLGMLLSIVGVRAMVAFAPAGTPRLDELRFGVDSVLAAVAVTVVVSLLASMAPVILATRIQLQHALRIGAQQGGTGRRFRWAVESLVASQVAVALVVVSAAGLVSRSLMKLDAVDLALDATALSVVELSLPFEGFGDTKQQTAFLERALPAVEGIPGVLEVSPVLTAPFAPVGGMFGQVAAEGQSDNQAASNPTLNMEVVAPNYFATLGIRLLGGRTFSDADREGAPPVVILSALAAEHYWPSADAIGKQLNFGPPGSPKVTVVGVVPETRYRDIRNPRLSIYFPLRQSVFPVAPMTLVIRSSLDTQVLAEEVRRAIRNMDPQVAVARVAPFSVYLDAPRSQPVLNAFLLSVFAFAAAILAAIGLFGVMATMVRQRTRELGVRMVLGATTSGIAWLVLRRGLVIAAVGALLGLLATLWVNQLLVALLFDIQPTDLPTLSAAVIILLCTAAIASLMPAWSGARVQPATVMKHD